VGTSEGDRPLAGLVSEEAEHLYARLAEAGWLEIGPGPDQVDLDARPARELVDARVAYQSAVNGSQLFPAAQPTALHLLLSKLHSEIATKQEEAVHAWQLLDSVLSAAAESHRAGGERFDSLAEVVTDRDRITRLAFELHHSTQHELLGLSTGRFESGPEPIKVITPPESMLSRGGQYRVIYDSAFAASKAGSHVIEMSVEAGERARIRSRLPLKMLYVDDKVALVALTETGMDGSLLVHSSVLLGALRDWFELLWNDSATTPVHGAVDTGLSASQRQILRLLSSGLSDDAIARASAMSVRTVRRHVSAILETLGVNSRFAAGAMAAKRGWI
jgi:DNA-binding CsgD family transcriptional regulator